VEVYLNQRERRVIQKIATIQLQALDKILRGDLVEDIALWCIEGQIEREALNRSIRRDIKIYEDLIERPEEFLYLKSDDLSLVKHILHRYIKKPSLQRAKKSIWRKMVYFDSFIFNPN